MVLKTRAHQLLDPVLAWRKYRAMQRHLSKLTDGVYCEPYDVPYVPQFATPTLINDYIHNNYDGTQDPNWRSFGAEDPADYAFWCGRVCALTCLKMALQAQTGSAPNLWELVQKGLQHDGYRVYDDQGQLIDEGWYVAAQIKLAADYGLEMLGHSYAPLVAMCQPILDGQLVAAAVSPEVGERTPNWQRYGGHLVLVYGFTWKNRRLHSLHLHNPSGRYPELQAGAIIPATRFKKLYAHRFSTLSFSG